MSLPEESRLTLIQRLRQDLKSDLIAGLLVVIPSGDHHLVNHHGGPLGD